MIITHDALDLTVKAVPPALALAPVPPPPDMATPNSDFWLVATETRTVGKRDYMYHTGMLSFHYCSRIILELKSC